MNICPYCEPDTAGNHAVSCPYNKQPPKEQEAISPVSPVGWICPVCERISPLEPCMPLWTPNTYHYRLRRNNSNPVLTTFTENRIEWECSMNCVRAKNGRFQKHKWDEKEQTCLNCGLVDKLRGILKNVYMPAILHNALVSTGIWEQNVKHGRGIRFVNQVGVQ